MPRARWQTGGGEDERRPAAAITRRLHQGPAREPRGLLPPWPAVLTVVAHPDDESFGLGAIIDKMTSAGAGTLVPPGDTPGNGRTMILGSSL